MDRVSKLAHKMVSIYEQNVDEDGILDEETFDTLGSIFEEVDPQDRAEVFFAFLGELDRRGIEYNKLEFGRRPN
jgi:hypothetical protein